MAIAVLGHEGTDDVVVFAPQEGDGQGDVPHAWTELVEFLNAGVRVFVDEFRGSRVVGSAPRLPSRGRANKARSDLPCGLVCWEIPLDETLVDLEGDFPGGVYQVGGVDDRVLCRPQDGLGRGSNGQTQTCDGRRKPGPRVHHLLTVFQDEVPACGIFRRRAVGAVGGYPPRDGRRRRIRPGKTSREKTATPQLWPKANTWVSALVALFEHLDDKMHVCGHCGEGVFG